MIQPRRNAPDWTHEQDPAELYEKRLLDKIAARWDARADTWDLSLQQPNCHLNEDEAYTRFLDEIHLVLERRRSFCAQGGVIDVGCGTGLVLSDVARSFAWGIGIDISNEMIKVACQKGIPNTRFLVGDAFDLPPKCPAAAAVLSRGVLLSHYGHIQGVELLKSLRRSLVPKGFLILDFLNLAARSCHRHVPGAKTYFRGEQVRQMALNAGFVSTEILGRMERRVLLLIAEVNI